jgi:hypothetical protein
MVSKLKRDSKSNRLVFKTIQPCKITISINKAHVIFVADGPHTYDKMRSRGIDVSWRGMEKGNE